MLTEIPDILSISQAAQVLGVGEMRVRDLCRKGQLTASQDNGRWRITKADIELYMASRTNRRGVVAKSGADLDGAFSSTPSPRSQPVEDSGPSPDGKPSIIHIPPEQLKEVIEFLHARGIVVQSRHRYARRMALQWQEAYREAVQSGETFDWRKFSDMQNAPLDAAPENSSEGTSYTNHHPQAQDVPAWQQRWLAANRPTFNFNTGEWTYPNENVSDNQPTVAEGGSPDAIANESA